jgi:hypothetical protein
LNGGNAEKRRGYHWKDHDEKCQEIHPQDSGLV